MKVVCSYCNKNLGDKEPLLDQAVTHGICKECYEYYKKRWNNYTLKDFLEDYACAVAVVDKEANVLALNSAAEKMFKKDLKVIKGSKVGDFVECAWAKMPGGCGLSEHCQACTIRKMLNITVSSGKPQPETRAYIWGGSESDKIPRKKVFISTAKEGDLIRIMIKE
jgi:transcriptional regulator with PAS, ATPase and Fis domain